MSKEKLVPKLRFNGLMMNGNLIKLEILVKLILAELHLLQKESIMMEVFHLSNLVRLITMLPNNISQKKQ